MLDRCEEERSWRRTSSSIGYYKLPTDRQQTITNTKRILGSFVFMVLPIVWARNAFSIAQIVIIYYNVNNWSRTTNQALAFLFVIFGELANLAILGLVLLGAMSFSKTLNSRPTSMPGRDKRASTMSGYTRDDVSEKSDV